MKKAILILFATLAMMAQSIHVRELPPEMIPPGSCTESHSGYLGIEEPSKNSFDLTKQEIGNYVLARMKQGYSLSLYPQSNGRIFSIATCEASASQSR